MLKRFRSASSLALIFVSLVLVACGTTEKISRSSPLGGPAQTAIATGWQLQDAATVPESGSEISQTGFAATNWHKATVPGTVLTTLVNDGVYPEPLYGENNRPNIIPETLCRTSYWYRTEFPVPHSYAGTSIWLNFHGINYIAQVWVNGHDLGNIKGAFARGVFDISPFVTAGETAAVAVQIQPPPHPGDPHEHTAAKGTGGNGGILSQDGPTFLCSLGWDWIPPIRDRDIGIWQKVELSSTGPVVLQDPLMTSDLPLPRTDVADLTFETTLRNVTTFHQSGILKGTFAGKIFQTSFELKPRESRTIRLTTADAPDLHVVNPLLWWPNGYGPANLYALHLDLLIANQISDSRDLNFGIRKITYEVPGSKNLTVSVNGVPIMCKGGDWGMDEAMKRVPRSRLEAQIRMHKEANFNMIRNWVGQSTSEDFYDLCDKNGIMVWDEFFQPNKSDGPNVGDVDMYLANVREKVLRFRTHPSIVIWCGRNESNPAPASVDFGIARIVASLDPTRLYHRNSAEGRGVHSGGPYSWRPPRAFYRFNEAFKTEIGCVSIPTLESIHAMMPEKDWETVNDDWAEHDLCRGAQEGRRNGPLYPDILAQRFGPIANLPDFVRKAQLANYEDFRAIYEGRLAKLFKPSTGVLTWMSNPAQPSFVWQIYSYDLEPLSSLFAAKKACEPVHVMLNQSNWHVMVVNNTPRKLEDLESHLRVFNLDGTLKLEQRSYLMAQPSATTDLGKINWPTDLSPVHFVKLELADHAGRLLSDNFYWRASPDHPDDFTALQSLPAAHMQTRISRHDDDGDNCLLDVTLTNSSNVIALMTHIQLRRHDSNERVLPVYYSDNYVTLLPGESRTIYVEAANDDLHGEEPLIAVDGWNITTTNELFTFGTGPSSATLNTQAQPNNSPTGRWTIVRPTPIPTIGLFDKDADIGIVPHPGKVKYDAAKQTYTITGNGENMWFAADAFHFLYRRFGGDFALEADVSFQGEGKNPHRKACLLIRQSLDPDSTYADIALHGSGLTSLQYRDGTGSATHEVQSIISAPARLRLEKIGNHIFMFLAGKDGKFQLAGASGELPFTDGFFIGLGVCSHEKDVSETAVFSNVNLITELPSIEENPMLSSTLETVTIASTDRRVVYVTPGRIEAPNWTPDGSSLIFNQNGHIYRIPAAGGAPELIDTGFANRCNNDHGISPDGKLLAISDQSAAPHKSIIYTVPIEGGTPTRITQNSPSYFHGWSPDGKTLAFCAQRDGKFGIFTIPSSGGNETRLTTAPDLKDGPGLDDGPEFSPDGKFIYFNSDRTGLMQIYRMRPDGSALEQITSDDANNWFAHLSPDAKHMAFLTFDKEVKGHPPDKEVLVRMLTFQDGKITVLAKLLGGQGTINVPSWSPDSLKLAFVSYEILPQETP